MYRSRSVSLAASLLPCLLLVSIHSSTIECAAAASTRTLCEQFENATTPSGRYTFLTDQWGLDSSGYQCMTVPANEPTSSNTTSFNATWEWSATGANGTTVHSFPNVNLNSPILPVQLWNVGKFGLAASWTLAPAAFAAAKTSTSDLANSDVAANVALDLFLDADPNKATSATQASREIMIWLASYGGVDPIGWKSITKYAPTTQVDGITFTLSHGYNGVNQSVYSWLPSKNLTSINTDVSPLVHYIWRKEYLEGDMYLGLAQFGSEAIHSAKGHNVTFSATGINMDVERGVPKEGRGSFTRPSLALLATSLVGIVLSQ